MIENIFIAEDIKRLKAIINEGNFFVLTCHTGPDGDALGSTLSFAHYLKALGKEAQVIVPMLTLTSWHGCQAHKRSCALTNIARKLS